MADAQSITGSDFPAYTDKDDLLQDLHDIIEDRVTIEDARMIYLRVGNSNLGGTAVSNPTRTVAAWESANLG